METNKHGYPFVGVFKVTLLTREFLQWVRKDHQQSGKEGYSLEFAIGRTMSLLQQSDEFRKDIFTYYTECFGMQPTKIAMVDFYQNKWSGRYWAEIDGEEVKPDQDDRFLSFSSCTETTYN